VKKRIKLSILSHFEELKSSMKKWVRREGSERKKGLKKKEKCVATAATPSAITMP